MEELQLVWVNKYNQHGVIVIPEREYKTRVIEKNVMHELLANTLNNIMLEDGSTAMCMEEDFEIVKEYDNDRSKQSSEQD